ncbi:alpha/beta hydrolase [Blastococcus sp. TF02A-26]|uniref:alpha/beta hydrolase n=1 Tax=Blastococcus sp. TF02A-26 TaxID=2250577 RepID=UPI000DEA54E4|nr:alpha/beta hydrolase [Blastococcus sp. TF02A-26]RBY84689.1 alpha/beta hydrolase [Blastococcus sp. TF02A-26]
MTLTSPPAEAAVPVDPELAAALAAFTGLPPLTAEMIPLLRRPNPMAPTDDDLACGGRFTVEERAVPGPAGAPEVRLLLCRPTDAPAPVGAVYYMHGGGMILGDNRMGVTEPLTWAQDLGLAVVSVDYRLAPETPHPGPVEDCYAGLVWTADSADELGIDPDRIVVAGTSAGGGLAAALTLMARDRGGPALAGQVLMAPMLDDRNDSASALQMAGTGVWDRAANEVGWNALLGADRGSDGVSPYAAPARATDLSGLPPAIIDVGSAETFRDEDVDYARRLWAAGGRAELHVWPGGFHGFDTIAPQAQLSQEAQAARLRWLRRLLAP